MVTDTASIEIDRSAIMLLADIDYCSWIWSSGVVDDEESDNRVQQASISDCHTRAMRKRTDAPNRNDIS